MISSGEEQRLPASLAARVHDGPLQLLAALSQELDEPRPDLDRARHLTERAQTELRLLLDGGPQPLSAAGLEEQLRRWAALMLGPDCTLELQIEPALDEVPALLARCAFELLSNAARHSGARHIRLWIGADQSALLLLVEDDGTGWDADRGDGFGLRTLRDGLRAFGGTVDHRRHRPHGTIATVRLPRGS